MRHVQKALEKMSVAAYNYIEIENEEYVKGVTPVVKFTIQSDPVSEVGVNGLQATDILEYVKNLFESLNAEVPCRENSLTITKIEEAINWQYARERKRIAAGIEGKQQ